ncbi:MAG TPA: ATP-binding protein [Acidimicrobiales bacterium]|nr:ATP-binding protein [Acidimicrobiales bacterium]
MDPIHVVLPLAGTAEDPPAAREVAKAACARAGCDEDLAGDVLLCLSELVTNALLHAGGPICVELTVSPTAARIEVTDRLAPLLPGLHSVAAARAALVDDERDRETGRGLAIVTQLTQAWGVDPADVEDRPGKVVWAELVASDNREPLASRRSPPVEADEPGDPPGTKPLDEAVLIDVPIRLYLASEAHLEALLREMQLLAADWSSRNDRLVRRLTESLRSSARARRISLEEARRRVDAGDDVLTLCFPISGATPSAAREFLDVVDLSETLTRRDETGDARFASELRHFRRWYVAELTHQAVGGDPRPCPFRP